MIDIAPPLYFVRHGETEWNTLMRYQGGSDISLSEPGRQQAAQNAALLRHHLGEDFASSPEVTFAASPLKRAQETAQIIARECGYDRSLETLPSFRELSMGRWEGLNSQQVKDEYPAERKARKCDRWGFKPVGGDSLAERHAAVRDAVEGLSSHSIIVAHAGILRIVLHVLGGEPIQRAAAAEIDHTCILIWDGAKLASYPHRTMG